MTATDELRRLLDERGVEYEGETDGDGWAFTRWHGFDDTGWLASSDELCGLLDLRGRYLFTPEQAIEATLGRGTCSCTTPDGTWCFVCSECGKSFPRSDLHFAHNHGEINFCPNCGRRVVAGDA